MKDGNCFQIGNVNHREFKIGIQKVLELVRAVRQKPVSDMLNGDRPSLLAVSPP
jgi:hypothetical protein